jgi:hypothetical protein
MAEATISLKIPLPVYALVNMEGKNQVMEFKPEDPFYLEVVASGVAFKTRKFCEQFCDESTLLEERLRKEEDEYLSKPIPEKKVRAVRKRETK